MHILYIYTCMCGHSVATDSHLSAIIGAAPTLPTLARLRCGRGWLQALHALCGCLGSVDRMAACLAAVQVCVLESVKAAEAHFAALGLRHVGKLTEKMRDDPVK